MNKYLERTLLVSAGALFALSLGGGVKASASTNVNQRGNALTSYISSRNFRFVRNHDYAEPDSYSNNYNQDVDPDAVLHHVGGNANVSYHPYAQLQDRDEEYNPQSVVIAKNGTVYVSYHVGYSGVRINRYPSINDVSDGSLNGVHYGPLFKGGHGQAMAYNPRTDQIWMLTNNHGSANHTSVLEISKRTLKPIRKITFNMEPYAMGDVLAFDRAGNAYTAIRTFGGAAPVGSLKLFKGQITNHSVRFHMVQGLRYAPGEIMQNMSYNPANDRLYFITDGEIMSVPASRFSHLRAGDVRADKLSGHYEFEGLAFHDGRGYLLRHYPSELMVSRYNGATRKARHHSVRRVRRHSVKRHRRVSRHRHRSSRRRR